MNRFLPAVKRAFAQPAFVVAVVVLGLCAASLNATVGYFRVKFTKEPVPLRVSSLREGIPEHLGHWRMISTDHAINPEIEEVLGTPLYVFRDYVDDRKISPAEIDQLRNSAAGDRDALLARLQADNPMAVMRIGVTYYTGGVDTVAHVPERCYVADGFEVTQHQTKHVTLGRYADGTPRSLDYSFLSFEDQTGLGRRVQRVSRNVGYVFHCDGRYLSSANEVRLQLQYLFERYGYYAKVEMMTAAEYPGQLEAPLATDDHNDSTAAMEDFLTSALPEIEKCLPDWQALHKK
jgi:hypothetical protein